MGEWHEIPELWKQGWTDRLVWLVTFALTVVRRSHGGRRGRHDPGGAAVHPPRGDDHDRLSGDEGVRRPEGREHILQDKDIPDYVAIFRIHGPFLFGATDKLATAIADAGELPPIVILRLRNMTAIDATGLRAIQDLADALREVGP